MMLKAQIADYITQNPLAITLDMASHFGKPEGEILCALPDEFVRVFPAERAEEVLAEISSWGFSRPLLKKKD